MIFHAKIQPPIRLLLAHAAGAYLRGIANPHFVSSAIEQIFEPVRVATSGVTQNRPMRKGPGTLIPM
jgi:hypothetical protein